MDPVYAIILAGDSEDRKIKQGSVIENKAFLQIHGRPMLEYVLDCYRSMDLAGIGVVGPPDKLADLKGITVIPQQGDMVANVVAAANAFQGGWLLLSSSDIPLITPQSVQDFLTRCRGADLFYPLVSKEDCLRVFPDIQRTWVNLTDGTFTGGNILLIRTDKVPIAAGPAGDFFAARKSPIQLAGLVGITTLAKLILNKLSIRAVERKMEKILGLDCKAMLSYYPEMGTDVDKETDYTIISNKISTAK